MSPWMISSAEWRSRGMYEILDDSIKVFVLSAYGHYGDK